VFDGALAVAAERFDLRDIAPQPWKNGAGLTREIAVGPRGASATDFDWRVSVAEVERAAPFSVFPGIDRCIVLLAGAGLHLRSDDHPLDHRLDVPCTPFHFSGDVPLLATLIGGPSRDLNVPTRRRTTACRRPGPAAVLHRRLAHRRSGRAETRPAARPAVAIRLRCGPR
jgi:uncharacterized protein